MTNCACDVIYIPGSGDGQQIFLNSLQDNFSQPVTYIGSDSVLSDADYKENPDLQMIPMLAGYVWSGGHSINIFISSFLSLFPSDPWFWPTTYEGYLSHTISTSVWITSLVFTTEPFSTGMIQISLKQTPTRTCRENASASSRAKTILGRQRSSLQLSVVSLQNGTKLSVAFPQASMTSRVNQCTGTRASLTRTHGLTVGCRVFFCRTATPLVTSVALTSLCRNFRTHASSLLKT